MIRNDLYAIFKGKEFRLDVMEEGKYRLVSFDSSDQQIGFEIYSSDSSFYVLYTSKQYIEYAYSIHTYGIYSGYKFQVTAENENQFCLYSNNLSLKYNELGFTAIGKYEYEKWVNKNEVAIFEEKEMKPNLFGMI